MLINKSHSIILFLCCLFAITAQAQAADDFGVSIVVQSDGENRWNITYPEGEAKRTAEQEEKILTDKIFPDVLKNAKAGKVPAVWQIGFFYLDGKGTEKNLQKAEEAFRIALRYKNCEGAIYLANHYHKQSEEAEPEAARKLLQRSEDLFLAALKVGEERAIPHLAYFASSRLKGVNGLERDVDAGLKLLDEIDKISPGNLDSLHARAKHYLIEKQYQRSFEISNRAIEICLDTPEESRNQAIYKQLRRIRFAAAVYSGNTSTLDPNEAKEVITGLLDLPTRFAWLVPGVTVGLFAFLVLFTWRSRKKGPGIVLAIMWIVLATLTSGIGFFVELPGLKNMFGQWIGAIIVALACFSATLILGWQPFTGALPWIRSAKSFFQTLAIFIGVLLLLQVLTFCYAFLYEKIAGGELPSQMVGELLKTGSVLELIGILLIAGLLVPFYEEVLYRGFLFGAIEKRWNAKAAFVASSLGFTLAHGLTYAIPILFLAIVLGWLRIKTGNLRLCFLLHALNNSVAVTTLYLVGQ